MFNLVSIVSCEHTEQFSTVLLCWDKLVNIII